MPTFLFNEVIFGPVQSRRLGISLGINLLPANRKACSFDCQYCECGLDNDKDGVKINFPSRDEVISLLEQKLEEMYRTMKPPDVITFAGNGEPTIHPEFESIIIDTITTRDKYFPSTRIAVLSNATRIGITGIFNALVLVDDNIQKLDSANLNTIKHLNQPKGDFNLEKTVELLARFNGRVVIQTLFTRGYVNGYYVDNSSDNEVRDWLRLVKFIAPREVMIYSLARATPVDTLQKIDGAKLGEIAIKARNEGILARVWD